MTSGLRRLYVPRQVTVRHGPGGVPLAVGGVGVEAIREDWLVEDRWWEPPVLHRRYYELVLGDGRDVVVFRTPDGCWYRQRS